MVGLGVGQPAMVQPGAPMLARSLPLPEGGLLRGVKASRKVGPGSCKRSQDGPVDGEQLALEQADTVEHKPDGRKCTTCPRKDDDWDPVCLHQGVKRFMWWGKPYDKNTCKSVAYRCGYCTKFFVGRIKIMNISIQDYETMLGNCPEKLEKHQVMIEVLIVFMIEKGVTDPHEHKVRLEECAWESMESRALDVIKLQSIKVQDPGWLHYELNYYISQFGSLEQNAHLGHCALQWEGVDGVVVPEAPVTRITPEQEIKAEIRQRVGDSNSGMTSNDLDVKQQALIANAFGTAGGSSLDQLLSKGPAAAEQCLPSFASLTLAGPQSTGGAATPALPAPSGSQEPSPKAQSPAGPGGTGAAAISRMGLGLVPPQVSQGLGLVPPQQPSPLGSRVVLPQQPMQPHDLGQVATPQGKQSRRGSQTSQSRRGAPAGQHDAGSGHGAGTPPKQQGSPGQPRPQPRRQETGRPSAERLDS
ncbi:hypothetical protein N9L68_02195 [bacterium]|nr:hypothetical protein [bacterium]